MLIAINPKLPMRNKEATKEFYIKKLGFNEIADYADYILLKNYISGKRQLTEYEKKAADINKDSNIKSADYILVKNYISGKYKLFI